MNFEVSRRSLLTLFCLLPMAGHAPAGVSAPSPTSAVDGVAPAAAIELAPNGLGHINIVPLYTVDGGFDTYLNLTNTDTRNGKAVKMRFLAAGAGDTVFNLTILMAPGDRWAAALTLDGPTGLPRLVHNDHSCTLPTDVLRVFGTDRLYGGNPASARTGHVEVITMADIPPRKAIGDPPLFNAVQPVAGVAPCTASALQPLAIDALSYADARAKGLDVPTTGLMTRWTLINVPRALSFTGVATALEARVSAGGPAGYGNLVLFPQTDTPITGLAAVRGFTADPQLRGGVSGSQMAAHSGLQGASPVITALSSDFPDLSTPYLPAGPASSNTQPGAGPRMQVHGVSQALAVNSFANEFVLEPMIQSRTEWVITMPTRRYEAGFAAHAPVPTLVFTDFAADDAGAALPVLSNFFWPQGLEQVDATTFCYHLFGGPSGLPSTASLYNRTGSIYADQEGSLKDFPGLTSGIPPISNELCGQTAILKVISDYDLSAAPIFQSFGVKTREYGTVARGGWARFATPGNADRGVPLIGFAAMELFNSASTPGMAGTYGQTFPHTMTRPD